MPEVRDFTLRWIRVAHFPHSALRLADVVKFIKIGEPQLFQLLGVVFGVTKNSTDFGLAVALFHGEGQSPVAPRCQEAVEGLSL